MDPSLSIQRLYRVRHEISCRDVKHKDASGLAQRRLDILLVRQKWFDKKRMTELRISMNSNGTKLILMKIKSLTGSGLEYLVK